MPDQKNSLSSPKSRTTENLTALRSKTLEDLRQIAPDYQGQSLSSEQLAQLLGVQPGTVRRGHCLNGHYLGLRPVKLPNGRLRWLIA